MDKPNKKKIKKLNDILDSIQHSSGKEDILVDLSLNSNYIAYLDFKGRFNVMAVDDFYTLDDNLKKVMTTKTLIGKYTDTYNYMPGGNAERYVTVKINPDCTCNCIPVTAIERIVLLEKEKAYEFQVPGK